jgi:hypothetical protein
LVIAWARPAEAVILTETFESPLGGFYSRWLGDNSNMGSYYLSAGNPDPNERGNNPDGLWISGHQVPGGGVGEQVLTIVFEEPFASTLSYLRFGVEAFVPQSISVFDVHGAQLFTGFFTGGDFGFGHESVVTARSLAGIGSIVFDSRPFTTLQISGNTSVDDFEAETTDAVPEPGTLTLLGLGLAVLGVRQRRKRAPASSHIS